MDITVTKRVDLGPGTTKAFAAQGRAGHFYIAEGAKGAQYEVWMNADGTVWRIYAAGTTRNVAHRVSNVKGLELIRVNETNLLSPGLDAREWHPLDSGSMTTETARRCWWDCATTRPMGTFFVKPA